MAPESLGLNTDATNNAEEASPFSADMVKNPVLPSPRLSWLENIPYNDVGGF